eukprot:scaffold36188_cov305-Skeletonema_dohrnii-CCMP3373.AAC.1
MNRSVHPPYESTSRYLIGAPKLEATRERHEEESAKRQQQQSVKQGGAAQQHNMMMADGSSAVQEIPSFASFAALFLPAGAHMNDCITRRELHGCG